MTVLIRHLLGWTGLLLCYFAGKVLVLMWELPLPAALTGLLLMLLMLFVRGGAVSVATAGAPLLRHMSVLFVPAVLGVGVYWQSIYLHGWALAAAIVGTTVVALGLTGLVAQRVLQRRLVQTE
ncbi:CidA/LrgA family protein [Alteromonas sp. ASW11-19]|uniref:CidA/LrgA family protein n=1 Tax=Alteromonas salexigens TaxID=2982530 RepID=A0ABT2VNG4_9ALTE|nr:CidA/LrgA family protein [Alteromonas salexigens]MCU7554838.1 CidA/LrgA family protein [Alteromonas salexigens]